MVVICFPDGTEWFKANWVFRQLIQDVAEMFPEDADLNYQLEKASAFGALFLDALDASSAAKILDAIKKAAEATATGELRGWLKVKPNDEDGQRMYLEAIDELLKCVQQQKSK